MGRTEFHRLCAVAISAGALLAFCAPAPASAAPANPAATQRLHKSGPQLVTPETGGRSLSRELSHTGGVIRPPPIGPHSTPVIPPPGTPGGNPNVKPK